jgi:hypothetical protein
MHLLNRTLVSAVALIVSLLLAEQAVAETAQLDFRRRDTNIQTAPSAEVVKQKIFVEFKGSPKASKMLRDQFRQKGFVIVENDADAEAKFLFSGLFVVAGAGKTSINGSLSELFEKSLGVEASTTPDYQHQSINLGQIAVSSFVMKAISVTDIFLWFSQVTGVAGRFNEALTGDPRGICMHKDCEKLASSVAIYVGGENGAWRIRSAVQNDKVVLDIVIAEAMERALAPLFDLQKNKAPMADAGEAAK